MEQPEPLKSHCSSDSSWSLVEIVQFVRTCNLGKQPHVERIGATSSRKSNAKFLRMRNWSKKSAMNIAKSVAICLVMEKRFEKQSRDVSFSGVQ
ncbi:hypothetical protein QL285_085020 [Trifolium repens]|nr:hypothetical protein QL285_085020 [Trifolium repens]